MNITALIVFIMGATVLWGGLIVTLCITIYNERKIQKDN